MKLYTHTGDKGVTSLAGGERALKCDPRIEAYGTVDELMAHIGYLHDMIADPLKREGLRRILDTLMNCAALLASEEENGEREGREDRMDGLSTVTNEDLVWLENETDRLSDGLPQLQYFTLPCCGDRVVSYSHVCRTVCRRAERRTVQIMETGYAVPDEVLSCLNRLSDYLYALGRRLGYDAGVKEVIWEGKKKK